MNKNAIDAATDAAVDQAGMPAIGRSRRSGKLMNVLALSAIAGLGLTFAVLSTGTEPKGKKPPKPHTEDVANQLAPLVMPDKPPAPPTDDKLALLPPATPVAAPAPAEKPEPTWQERKMGAEDGQSAGNSGTIGTPDSGTAPPAPPAPATAPPPGTLAARLEPSTFPAARATRLPDLNYVIAAGRLLDCILDTAIDSTLPGLVKCHLPAAVYSENRHVMLLEAGTELLGEQGSALLQGQARQFVVFTRIKTGNGVVAAINSPATDALGASGIPGWIDTQFGKRFGAAMMIALVQDAAAIAVARSSSGAGQNTLVLGNSTQAGSSMAEKALEASVNIPPILHVNQGAHIQVMLARDLDFRDVYALETRP